ncbi:bifunctional diaminohydroxyphosphoribosylaminopyrimidine deaminase/5-amino-6-(5-phosphoribosylamino)uracil reductase RibD [Candidatus Peribacteria bacterium]|nr:bifunctional diaminohydroxyphosphoribosylaminopyrimidine deaminase/5-amino-6-(5-phosphoribosylamino)uracil reductase RibD [Candidatus Peribacteria bacterium]
MQHSPYMHRCLELAQRGRGSVGINPMVGAVLVRDGKIIVEAWHREFGADHAERELIKKFDQDIRPTDVLYVNMEPCCHHGKTPPCTEVILHRGIRRVVFGMVDPNPQVAGQGISVLRAAGVEVIGPVERARCEWFNRGFVSLMRRGRPWITLKRAQTLGGRIARDDGSPLKITSQTQDAWSHRWLRSQHDVLMVGVETIIRDDPLLTVRNPNTKSDQLSPLRIVLDPKMRIQMNARILSRELAPGTVIIAGGGSLKKKEGIRKRGARVWECPLQGGLFQWRALWKILTTPQENFHGIASILTEGGAKTWQAFQASGSVDAEIVLVGSS